MFCLGGFCLFVFGDSVSPGNPGCPGTLSVDQAGLKLTCFHRSARVGLSVRAFSPQKCGSLAAIPFTALLWRWEQPSPVGHTQEGNGASAAFVCTALSPISPLQRSLVSKVPCLCRVCPSVRFSPSATRRICPQGCRRQRHEL